jgi:hypothetical protein
MKRENDMSNNAPMPAISLWDGSVMICSFRDEDLDLRRTARRPAI